MRRSPAAVLLLVLTAGVAAPASGQATAGRACLWLSLSGGVRAERELAGHPGMDDPVLVEFILAPDSARAMGVKPGEGADSPPRLTRFAVWSPLSSDSIRAVWIEGRLAVEMRLEVEPERMTGAGRARSAGGPVIPVHVTAVKESCSADLDGSGESRPPGGRP